MEDNKKKKTIIFSVIAVVTMLVSVVGITYAFFNADTTENEAEVNVNASTASKRDVFSTSGEPTISLNVTSDKMQYADKGSVAVSDEKTMSVSLEAGSGKAYCTYDLTYIPDNAFVGSGLDNELTIELTDGKRTFEPVDIKGNSNVLLGHFSIIDEYESSSVATNQNWSIIGKFNNLSENQNDSINKTFSGTIEATNVVCQNTLEDLALIEVNTGNVDTFGSEISIGNEQFYVISSDVDTVTMLSKYNLLVGFKDGNVKTDEFSEEDEGYNLQSVNAKASINSNTPYVGGIYFTYGESYWDDGSLKPQYGESYPAYVYDENSNIFQYLDRYKTILGTDYNVDVAEARLLTHDEYVALKCSKDEACIKGPDWVLNTSFWFGTASTSTGVYALHRGMALAKTISTSPKATNGVRPVLVLDKSLFE